MKNFIYLIAVNIIFLILIGLGFPESLLCEEKPKEVKWEVVIKVTYNAISEDAAHAKVRRVLDKHKEARKAEVNIKKVGSGDTAVFHSGSGTFGWPDSGATLTPN